LHRMVPWFILGFIVMIALRSAGLIPAQALGPISGLTQVLTVLAMAGLGLQTDLRAVAKSGGRAVLAAVLSLAVLLGLALLLIRLLAL
ncbi:MAG: putative sulfate exporter family transporter, partial [Brevundimonas sp.]